MKNQTRTATDHPAPASTGREPTKICRKKDGCEDMWKCSSAVVGDCGARNEILQPAPATGGGLDVEAERREFEASFPVPEYVSYDDGKYIGNTCQDRNVAEDYNAKWEVWQARACRAPSNNSPAGGKADV